MNKIRVTPALAVLCAVALVAIVVGWQPAVCASIHSITSRCYIYRDVESHRAG